MQYAYIQKKIQGLFKHHALISQNSQTFPKLEKTKNKFNDFSRFQGPVGTLWVKCEYESHKIAL